MKAFAALFAALDASSSTNDKVALLEEYFGAAEPRDAAWALHVLMGNRPRRILSGPALRVIAAAETGLPLWLVEASHHQVGDLAETVALLLGERDKNVDSVSLADIIEQRLLPLRRLDEHSQRDSLRATWAMMNTTECLVFNKLLTGAFRVGVGSGLVTRAVARASNQPVDVIAYRLMGAWEPSAEAWTRLVEHGDGESPGTRPFPFCLAAPIDGSTDDLGAPADFLVEWKWDGIRAQVVRRDNGTWVWSRGEEMLNGRFPEIEAMATRLNDGTVLDGEILAWDHATHQPLPFASLQRRIQRKTPSRRIINEVPVVFVAYDLLEADGVDIRNLPMDERRQRLETVVESLGSAMTVSPLVDADSWNELAAVRENARSMGTEGFMIKRRDAPYARGRVRGTWWKWKVDPLSIDAVLTAAQPGSGRRAGLYTDYTFGVWHAGVLVTIAKAYSGLTDAEIREVDRFVRRHTTDRFGPVRMVEPRLVFELAFEGIRPSKRHKSGLAVRFPRIARWRTDKLAADADTLETVRQLLDAQP
ncbi:MAG: ATP-dependent DNA ligase [Gemmatimonadales bacterium]